MCIVTEPLIGLRAEQDAVKQSKIGSNDRPNKMQKLVIDYSSKSVEVIIKIVQFVFAANVSPLESLPGETICLRFQRLNCPTIWLHVTQES